MVAGKVFPEVVVEVKTLAAVQKVVPVVDRVEAKVKEQDGKASCNHRN